MLALEGSGVAKPSASTSRVVKPSEEVKRHAPLRRIGLLGSVGKMTTPVPSNLQLPISETWATPGCEMLKMFGSAVGMRVKLFPQLPRISPALMDASVAMQSVARASVIVRMREEVFIAYPVRALCFAK